MDWLVPVELLGEHALVALVSALATALAVVIHYEGVRWLAMRYSRRNVTRSGDRRAMLKIIFALLALHVAEIWCYGIALWALVDVPGVGSVHGDGGVDTLFDAVYLSTTTFTTVGFGDLTPTGAIRLLSGCEALTGLLLITWSASFTYLEMSRRTLDTSKQRRAAHPTRRTRSIQSLYEPFGLHRRPHARIRRHPLVEGVQVRQVRKFDVELLGPLGHHEQIRVGN